MTSQPVTDHLSDLRTKLAGKPVQIRSLTTSNTSQTELDKQLLQLVDQVTELKRQAIELQRQLTSLHDNELLLLKQGNFGILQRVLSMELMDGVERAAFLIHGYDLQQATGGLMTGCGDRATGGPSNFEGHSSSGVASSSRSTSGVASSSRSTSGVASSSRSTSGVTSSSSSRSSGATSSSSSGASTCVGVGVFVSARRAVTVCPYLRHAPVGTEVDICLSQGRKRVRVISSDAHLGYTMLELLPDSADHPHHIRLYTGDARRLRGGSVAVCSFLLQAKDQSPDSQTRMVVMRPDAMAVTRDRSHLVFVCKPLMGQSGTALVVHNGELVGLHIGGMAVVRARSDQQQGRAEEAGQSMPSWCVAVLARAFACAV